MLLNLFISILLIFIVATGAVYAFKALFLGIKLIQETEKEKEKDNEDIWVLGTVIGFIVFGIGLIVPIVYAVVNKKHEELKKLMVYLTITIIGIIGGIIAITIVLFNMLEPFFSWIIG